MVPKTVRKLELAGVSEADIEKLVWDNPIDFFAQSGRLDKAALEQSPSPNLRDTFDGNSVLRGQDPDKY